MDLRGFRISCALAAAVFTLTLLSCGHSLAPTASPPGGQLVVHVTQNGDGPSPGKRIEVVGVSLSQTTDANGLASFVLLAGPHVVRAYDIGTPGPGRPFVEQGIEVTPGQTARLEFFDCVLCR
jgi:hypothetical protein